jgi:head-tail adaptor
MRYQCEIMPPGERTATGAVARLGKNPRPTLWCDIKERDTTEGATGERLTQQRAFEVALRHTTDITRNSRIRLYFHSETLDCNILAITQIPREGRTQLVAVTEA